MYDIIRHFFLNIDSDAINKPDYRN